MNNTIDLADGAYNRLQRIFSKIHSTPLTEPFTPEQIGDLKLLTEDLWDNLINKQYKHALISFLLPGDNNELLENSNFDSIKEDLNKKIAQDKNKLKKIRETYDGYKQTLINGMKNDLAWSNVELDFAKKRQTCVVDEYEKEKEINNQIKELLSTEIEIRTVPEKHYPPSGGSMFGTIDLSYKLSYLKNSLTGELEPYTDLSDVNYVFENELIYLSDSIKRLEAKIPDYEKILNAADDPEDFGRRYNNKFARLKDFKVQIEFIEYNINNREKMLEVIEYLGNVNLNVLEYKNIDNMKNIDDILPKIQSLITASKDRLKEQEKYNNKKHLVDVETKLLTAFETGNAEMKKILALLNSKEFVKNKNSYKYFAASFFMGAVIAALSMPVLLVNNFIMFTRSSSQILFKLLDNHDHPEPYAHILDLPLRAAAVGVSLVPITVLSIAYTLAQAISIIAYLPKAALHADMKENEVYNSKIQLIESLNTLEKLLQNLNVFSNDPNKKWQGVPPSGITENDHPSLLRLFEKTIKSVFSEKQCEDIKDILNTYAHIDINRAAKSRLSAIDGSKIDDQELTRLLKEHFNHRFSSLEIKLASCKKEPSKANKDEIKKLEAEIKTLEQDFKSIISELKKGDIPNFCKITMKYLDNQMEQLKNIVNNEQQNVSSLTFSNPQQESSVANSGDGKKSGNQKFFDYLKEQLEELEQGPNRFKRG